MCVTQNVFFECGCLEDTKYDMCDKAMIEMGHMTQTAPPIFKTHPCANCFARGLEEKARRTREEKGKKDRQQGGSSSRMDES